jgi:hypothetical protein
MFCRLWSGSNPDCGHKTKQRAHLKHTSVARRRFTPGFERIDRLKPGYPVQIDLSKPFASHV